METTQPVTVYDPRNAVIVVDELVDPADGTIGNFDITLIRASYTNRKHFKEQALQELATNIKATGIIQPLVLRPIRKTSEDPFRLEIVAGERRFRASKIAELPTVFAIVRHLTDQQAREVQILENLQRENPHPLEEALGLQELMLQFGYTADQLAAKLAISRSSIYAKLKLCSLNPSLHDAFYEDKLTPSVALLISRIPTPGLQAKAAAEVLTPDYRGEAMSFRAAQQLLNNRYMLDLAKAPFELKDAKLCTDSGSCIKCPKRTGNQPEIFTDVGADVCTDPDCFAEKRAAHANKQIAEALKKNIPVIEGSEVHSARQGTVELSNSIYYLDRVIDGKEGSIGDLLPTKLIPAPKCLIKLTNGDVATFYEEDEIQKALEKAGVCETEEQEAAREAAEDSAAAAGTSTSGASAPALTPAQQARIEEEKRQEEAAARETNFRVSLYRQVRQRGLKGFSVESLRVFVNMLLSVLYDQDLPLKLLADVYPFQGRTDNDVREYIKSASLEELQLLIVDLFFGNCLEVGTWELDELDGSDEFNALTAIAKHEGIDPQAVRQALDEPTPGPEPMVEPAKPAAKKATKAALSPAAAWPFPQPGKAPAAPAAPAAKFENTAWPFPKSGDLHVLKAGSAQEEGAAA